MIEAPKKPTRNPAAIDPTCYRTTRDILIPAGTVLRQAAAQRGGRGYVECGVGHNPDFMSHLVVQVHADAEATGVFRKVSVA